MYTFLYQILQIAIIRKKVCSDNLSEAFYFAIKYLKQQLYVDKRYKIDIYPSN